jgi:hypothetical protein
MPDWRRLRAEIEGLERRREDRCHDRGQWDWYAGGCPCGLPLGECREHPRARSNQRPPGGDWRTWLLLMGRGAGKTRSAAEWVRHRVESGASRRLALVGATAADVRDTMVDGESGILAISPPWFRPRYEPTRRRLTWPNGARATTFSADEPDRLRGPQHDAAWLDELAAFRYPAAFDNLLFGLRLGADPRLCVTTTPRPVRLVTDLIGDPTTAIARGTTYDNRANLAPSFFDRIVNKYEGTRLGDQELMAEVLEIGDGVWFPGFDPQKHMSESAEYDPRFRVHLAIDCGVSRHVGAVWFQARELAPGKHRVTVFGDYHAEGLYSEAAARAIRTRGEELTNPGRLDSVRLDPAASARTGIGPTAYGEFARIFGERLLDRWPSHRVTDGLDQLEVLLETGCLVIHPRCVKLKAAFQNYARKRTGRGDWLDEPADPQHPHEDLMDALRGGVRDRFPEGRIEQPTMRMVPASRFM